MKNKSPYAKRFAEIATSMGFINTPLNVLYDDPVTKKQRFMLINNHKRFVKGMLELPISVQKDRLRQFDELQQQAMEDMQSGKLDVETLIREAQSSESLEASDESDPEA